MIYFWSWSTNKSIWRCAFLFWLRSSLASHWVRYMLGTSITAFMRNNFSHWSWILHHSISTLDFQSEGFQQSALYSAFSRHRFHQSTDILHTQVTPPSAAPKTWHHFWNRNHLIKHHWLSPSHNIIDSASQIGQPLLMRVLNLPVTAQEGWGQKVLAQPLGYRSGGTGSKSACWTSSFAWIPHSRGPGGSARQVPGR